MALLGQPRPDAYRIGAGDVLGVWIEGALGERGQQPPVLPPVRLENVDLPPATGFPIQVRTDGTIPLPFIAPAKVEGMTFAEAEEAIGRAYTGLGVLQPRARIVVNLARPRTYHVLVLRQDSPTPIQAIVSTPVGLGAPEYIGVARKGTGWDLVLPAYQNDVLTALARSGGLPGTDAADLVVVERNARREGDWATVIREFEVHGPPHAFPGSPIVSIPLRAQPGTPLLITPEQVTLQDGDVVFIPAREERLFYTGGLLPPGEHIMPRDHDLDVLEAVVRSRGPLANGGFGISNLSGTLIQTGIGQPSPTQLTVIRRLPCGGQIPIQVDLSRALVDGRERILVQPSDLLILQETPGEAMTRYFTQVFDVSFVWKFVETAHLFGAGAIAVPGGTAPVPVNPVMTTITP
jgi:protein involved in polysaccharide export with SLBB domain